MPLPIIRAVRVLCPLLVLTVVAAGCTVRSVDEKRYVAKNEAVLAQLPLPRATRLLSTYSIGQPAQDGFPPSENGPPYSSFTTWRVYEFDFDSHGGGADSFFAHELPPRGWDWIGGGAGGCDDSYVRGHALVYVSCTENGFMLSADHDAR